MALDHPVRAFSHDFHGPSPLWCYSRFVILRLRERTSGKHGIPQRVQWHKRMEPNKDESKFPWIEEKVS